MLGWHLCRGRNVPRELSHRWSEYRLTPPYSLLLQNESANIGIWETNCEFWTITIAFDINRLYGNTSTPQFKGKDVNTILQRIKISPYNISVVKVFTSNTAQNPITVWVSSISCLSRYLVWYINAKLVLNVKTANSNKETCSINTCTITTSIYWPSQISRGIPTLMRHDAGDINAVEPRISGHFGCQRFCPDMRVIRIIEYVQCHER